MPPKKVKVVDVITNDNDNDNDVDNDENTVEDQPEVIEANTEELAIATPTIDTIPEQQESESTEEEAQSTVIGPPEEKNVRINELVECTKCGKKMTKKTLKYTHEKTCPSNPDKKKNQSKK